MKEYLAFGLGALALMAAGAGARAQDPSLAPKPRDPVATSPRPGTPVPEPTGTWLTEGGESRIRFGKCGLVPCGTIVWAKEESKDENNPDPALRNRSIIGIPLITNIQPDKEGGWTASLYNPDNGKTYDGKLRLKDPNTLEVSGCVLGGLICGSQIWARVNEPPAGARGEAAGTVAPVQRAR